MAAPASKGTARDGIVAVLAILLTCAALAWAADLYRAVGLLLFKEQFIAGILGLALPLIFLTPRKHADDAYLPPWYDVSAAVVGFVASWYMAIRFPVLNELAYERPVDGLITGSCILVLVVEGLRRKVGWVLTLVVLAFFFLTLLGPYLPGELEARPIRLTSLLYTLTWDPSGMLGLPMVVVSTIVINFVFFGQILLRSGGSAFFTDLSMLLVGRYRGGQAKIAVTASGLFGSISGSAVSNVVTTGVVTIPLMRKAGYTAYQAGAIEAVASTGGQLMPPIMGAAAFLMAEFLEISYAEVVVAALCPSLLYYLALFIQTDLEAARRGIQPIDKSERPRVADVMRDGWYFPIPFAVLIITLFFLQYTPEMAALTSTLVMIALSMVFGYKGHRLTAREVVLSLKETGHAVLDIVMIGAGAGIVIGALAITGIGFTLTFMLVQLGSDNLYLMLVLAALICIILGMGMPTSGVYILLATLVAPSLVEAGIQPIAAHLFILYFGMMSFITPPVAIAAFAAATLTGANAMKTGFVALQFGWLAYIIPFVFVTSPSLLLQGKPLIILIDLLSAALAVWLVSIGIVGYLRRRLNIPLRLLFVAAGLGLLTPVGAFDHARWMILIAALTGLTLLSWAFFARPRQHIPG